MAKELGKLLVSDEVFKDDKGNEVKYKKYYIVLNGEEIGFYPKANSKALLQYLMKDNK